MSLTSVSTLFTTRRAGVVAAVLSAALLAACGSNVKLDDVPVVDRTGTTANGAGGPGGQGG